MTAIEAVDLTKVFYKKKFTGQRIRDAFFPVREKVIAVDKLNISVNKGEKIAVVGPNGAGKTTILKMFAGILRASSGSVSVNGSDPHAISDARTELGLMLNSKMIYNRMTGRDNLRYYAQLYNVGDYEKSVERIQKTLDIGDWLDTYVEQYSSGMRVRLAFARALIHSPSILLLDEPTASLDPQSERGVLEFISSLKSTVLLSSHHLSEIMGVCDKIAVINEGRLLEFDTEKNLAKRYGKDAGLSETIIKITGGL